MGNQTSAERGKRHNSNCPQRSPPSKEQSSRLSNEGDRKSGESTVSASKEITKSQSASKELNTAMSMSKEGEVKTKESAESESKEKAKMDSASKELNTAISMSKEGMGGKTKESFESGNKQSPSKNINMSNEPERKEVEAARSESMETTKTHSASKESQAMKSTEGEGKTKESVESGSKEKLLSFSPLKSKMNSQFAPLDLELGKAQSGGAAGTPTPSAEPLLEEKTAKSPTARSPGSRSPEMKTAVDTSPRTKEISSRRKTLSERRALAEKERTLTAQKMANTEPISPPKSDIDDHGYVNLAELDLVSARSPSDTNMAKTPKGGGIGQNLVMGISGLWSKSMNWWTSKEGDSSARTPVSEEMEVQTAQEKSVSARSAVVMITEPINGRKTVNKHDERYQTLYGLKDPFEDVSSNKNKTKK